MRQAVAKAFFWAVERKPTGSRPGQTAETVICNEMGLPHVSLEG